MKSKKTNHLNLSSELKFESYGPGEISEELIFEVSNYFRYIFNNEWPDFAVCTSCDNEKNEGMRMSIMEVLNLEDPLSLEEIDIGIDMPNCPCCNKVMKVFHDPEVTLENIDNKLVPNGHVSLLKNPKQEISGMTYGYKTTLRGAFASEWSHPHLYINEEDKDISFERSFEDFFELFKDKLPDSGLHPEMDVLVWNCVALSRSARGKLNFFNLVKKFFDSFSDLNPDQIVIGECVPGSSAHYWFKTLGATDIDGFLGGGETFVAFKLGDVIERLSLDPESFHALRKKIINLSLQNKSDIIPRE